MKEHQDFDIYIGRNLKTTITADPDLKLIYVINGALEVRVNGRVSLLNKNDLAVINPSEHTQTESKGRTDICGITWHNPFITDFFGGWMPHIFCDSVADRAHSYKEMRNTLRELVYLQVLSERRTDGYRLSLLYRILDLLAERFVSENEGSSLSLSHSSGDDNIKKVLAFVHHNYQDKLSLSDIASSLYVSTSSLSRAFLKETGTHFVDYVNEIRLGAAASDLRSSQKNVTRIALDCGFSNASSLNRLFRDRFHMTPTEYREKMSLESKAQRAAEEEDRRKLSESFKAEGIKGLHQEDIGHIAAEIVMPGNTDKKSRTPLGSPWKYAVNMGPVSGMTRSNLQFHAQYLTQNLGFTHIRLWNVFSKRLLITDGRLHSENDPLPDGTTFSRTNGYYNYDELDSVFDFLAENNISVFLDLGRRPDMAISSSGKAVFFEEEYIDFESMAAWKAMVKDFIRHLARRYGRDTIEQWVFELIDNSTEEVPLWGTDPYDYFEAFSYLVKTVRHYAPAAKVGGPSAVPGQITTEQYRTFISRCREADTMPDFYSIMLFPYYVEPSHGFGEQLRQEKSQPVIGQDALIPMDIHSNEYELNHIRDIRNMLRECGAGEAEIYITEWNGSISNRDHLNDSCYRSAYFVSRAIQLADQVDCLCVWIGSDWISSYYDSRLVANGGAGLITKDMIRKPAYYAVDFLNQMGRTFIEKSDHFLVAKNSDTDYTILAHNFKQIAYNTIARPAAAEALLADGLEPDGRDTRGSVLNFSSPNGPALKALLKNPERTRPGEIDRLYEDAGNLEIEFILKDLPLSGDYAVRISRVNPRHGNILHEWGRFSYDAELRRTDIKYIRNSCIPVLESRHVVARNGRLTFEVELEPEEITYIRLVHEEE